MTSEPARAAKFVTIINLKEGVGKTHTVWLLTGACMERGKRLLAVDADIRDGNLYDRSLVQ